MRKKLLIVTQKVDSQDQLLGFFIDWLSRFAAKFEKITVLCLEKGQYVLPENMKVISLGKDRGESKLKQLFNFYFLIFTLRNDYDAVFVHMNPIWVVLGGISWRLMGKKIFFWYTSGGVTPKLKLAEKLTDTIFTASKESFRLPSKKVIVTGHGIDTGVFTPVNHKSPIRQAQGPEFIEGQTTNHKLKILSVGRIAPVKNYETLIDAAKIFKDKGLDFSVTMAGEAPPLKKDTNYKLQIINKIKALGLENNFNFVGKINHKNLPEYYQSHDIFIHLSKTGSIDKTLLEAMACGIKVISSNDSARSFLPDNLIFGENNPTELVDRIMTIKNLATDPGLREYVVKNHSLENLINKLSNLING